MSEPRLLQYYARLGRLRGLALERTALRAESVHMREVLTHLATAGRFSFTDLSQRVLSGGTVDERTDYEAAASLAWVVALQNREENDIQTAIKLLEAVLPQWAHSEVSDYRYYRLLSELYFEQGEISALTSLITDFPRIRRYFHGYIPVDAQNPFIAKGSQGSSSYEKWLRGFNRMFTERDLMPVHMEQGGGEPFNRLRTASRVSAGQEGPKVSVIMTSYKPVKDDIMQSARSILNQTWADLELIVVDDASPDEYTEILDELEVMDPRVRLIRLETNGGTYRARNRGLREATGAFITGQDADDWSHPQRIEVQVKHLLKNPLTPGNQVYTVNITADLVRIRSGYHPFIPSAPTLMVRSEIMHQLGGYLPARKAADNELRGRVAAYTGAKVEAIQLPLIFMRILPDSLSRADFRPGWQHPARRAFWSAYRTWHRTASAKELRAGGGAEEFPIHVPARFAQAPAGQMSTDVVFLADLCEDGALQVSMVDEIRALKAAGLRVGVMHVENAQYLSTQAREYHLPLQEMISAGEVTHVIADEEFHQVGLLVVRSPEVLQFMPAGRSAFTPARLWVVAHQPADSEPVTYLPQACADHAEEFFGLRPEWAGASIEVQQQLSRDLPAAEVQTEIYQAPFDPTPFRVPRRQRNLRPLIGRWAGQLPEDWPVEPAERELLWPQDGSAEVRLYGDASNAAQILGGQRLPAEWVAFGVEDIDRCTYYRSLDFFVHYPGHRVSEPQRPVLEALAAGVVTILPPSQRCIYGEAAVYAEPTEVPHLVQTYWNDGDRYSAQSQRAAAFSARGSEQEYIQMMVSAVRGVSHKNQEAQAS